MFGSSPSQPPATPEAPPPPPNPPMFGSNSSGTNQVRKQTQANSGFAGTVIGGAQPAQTGQKQLMGQ